MQSPHCSLWSAWTLHPCLSRSAREQENREIERARDGGRDGEMWNNRAGRRVDNWWRGGRRGCHLGSSNSSSFFSSPSSSLSSCFLLPSLTLGCSFPGTVWQFLPSLYPSSLPLPLSVCLPASPVRLFVQVFVSLLPMHHSSAINWLCVH